jgi:hypothetical protein
VVGCHWRALYWSALCMRINALWLSLNEHDIPNSSLEISLLVLIYLRSRALYCVGKYSNSLYYAGKVNKKLYCRDNWLLLSSQLPCETHFLGAGRILFRRNTKIRT